MATGTILEKNVYFLGSWKVKKLSDRLQNDISKHANDKQGLACVLSVSNLGIQLCETNNAKSVHHGLIPEKNVMDIMSNRYQAYCMMCVVKDEGSELLNVMVWKCRHQHDVSHILSCFLVDKHHGRVSIKNRLSSSDHTRDPRNRISTLIVDDVFANGETRHFRDSMVQTDPLENDVNSMAGSSKGAIMDEIQSLQREVQRLRLMVQTSEVSHSQYFVRRRIFSRGSSDHYEYVPVKVVDAQGQGPLNGHPINKSVRQVPTHDRRSFAIQTEQRRYREARRTGRDITRAHVPRKHSSSHVVLKQRHRRSQSEPKYRENSYSSNSVSRQYQRMESDSSDYENKKILGYVTLPPGEHDWGRETAPLWSNGHVPQRSKTPADLRTTIEKPIENVYGTPRYKKNNASVKPRQEITPYTFVGSDNNRMTNGGGAEENNNSANKPINNGGPTEINMTGVTMY